MKDLMNNRPYTWEYVIEAIEKSGKNKIVDTKALSEGIKTEGQQLNEAINHQRHTYSQQLKAYLHTYTSGELNIWVWEDQQ